MGNLRMNADQISYKGGEKPMSVEEAIKNAGNTGLAHTADIAPDFSTESAYSAGDFVYHNGTLYVFTADHAAGAWSTSDTQVVTVGGEISTLMSGLTNLTKYSNLANGASVNITGSMCILFAFRADSITSNTVNAVAFCTSGTLSYLVNSGGNTSPLSASYSNGVTTVTNNNSVAVNFGSVVLTN